MIYNSEKQPGVKIDVFYTLNDGLLELIYIIKNHKKIDNSFIKKWNPIIGSAGKVYEGLQLLKLLYEIDDELQLMI